MVREDGISELGGPNKAETRTGAMQGKGPRSTHYSFIMETSPTGIRSGFIVSLSGDHYSHLFLWVTWPLNNFLMEGIRLGRGLY